MEATENYAGISGYIASELAEGQSLGSLLAGSPVRVTCCIGVDSLLVSSRRFTGVAYDHCIYYRMGPRGRAMRNSR
jgi:hypothetical protein